MRHRAARPSEPDSLFYAPVSFERAISPGAARFLCVPERRHSRKKVISLADATAPEPTRRDFIYIATGAAGAVGVALAAWPFIDQMNPTGSVLALSSIEVDLSPIQPGQQVVLTWRSHPLFVRRRTPKEIAESRAVPVSALLDPLARNAVAVHTLGRELYARLSTMAGHFAKVGSSLGGAVTCCHNSGCRNRLPDTGGGHAMSAPHPPTFGRRLPH